MLPIIGGQGGAVQVNNCSGIVPNSNCAGNLLWNPPNGNWWTWGAAGVPTTNCANVGAFDYAGGNTETLTPVSVSSIAVGVNGFQNCNCGAFNCKTNCNCNCACNCNCCTDGSCFPAGSKVTMADGSIKLIEDVKIGEWLRGARGEANQVLALDRPLLGRRKMAIINGRHWMTLSHPILTPDGRWALLDRAEWFSIENKNRQPVIIDDEGTVDHWVLPGILEADHDLIIEFSVGTEVIGKGGKPERIERIEIIRPSPDLQLYNFVMLGSHTYTVNDFATSGFLNGIDFDYRTYTPRGAAFAAEDYRAGRVQPKL